MKKKNFNDIEFGSSDLLDFVKEQKKKAEESLKHSSKKKNARFKTEEIKLLFDDPFWTSRKVEMYDYLMNTQTFDEYGIDIKNSPYISYDIKARREALPFKYTKEEIESFRKCKEDVCYFADNFVKAKAEDGRWKNIKLRDYQYAILKSFQNDRNAIVLASRQIGKSVMMAIFVLWYCIFEQEKNVLITSYVKSASLMVISNIQEYYLALPFWLKPGVKRWLQGSMHFENRNVIMGEATTVRSATGRTIDLSIMDELGKVEATKAPLFLAAVFPTLASIRNSKCLICSTPCYYPNGEFDRLYLEAVAGKNDFVPHRVDWWQIPGRDEEWSQREIQKIGKELFNREYGLQFYEIKDGLVKDKTRMLLERIKVKFENPSTLNNKFLQEYLKFFWFDPKYNINELKDGHFVISVDFAEGGGGDYTVANIFQLVEASNIMVKNIKKSYDMSRKSYMRLRQVGYFSSNITGITEFSKIFNILVFRILNPAKIKILFEVNDNRYIPVYNEMREHPDYEYNMLVRTEVNDKQRVGVLLRYKNRRSLFFDLSHRIANKQIILRDERTINQINSFGLNEKGIFTSLEKHDDLALTCVNLCTFYNEDNYNFLADDFLDEKGKLNLVLDTINSLRLNE